MRLLAGLKYLGDRLARPSSLPIQFKLTFSAPMVFLGAESMDQLNLTASAKPGEPVTGAFETGLPGQSHLKLSGAFESGAGAGFRGQAEAHIGDFRALGDWAAEGEPEFAAQLAGLGNAFPYSTASATGDLEASAVGFSARNLKLTVDRSAFTGAVAFTQPHDNGRGRLFIDLHSNSLDIDAAPNLAGGAASLADTDLSLAIEASKLRIARVGQATLDSGSLVLKATKTGAAVSLDRLSLSILAALISRLRARSRPAANGRRFGSTLRICAISPNWSRAPRQAVIAGCFSSGPKRSRPPRRISRRVGMATIPAARSRWIFSGRTGRPARAVFP